MFLNNKTPYIISIFLFVTPILAFLNKINLPQVIALNIFLISLSQFFFLIIVFFLSYLIHNLFFKKKIEFKSFFLINSLITFLLFFFQNIKALLFFEKQNFIFDEIFAFLIFVLIYFFLIKFVKKNLNLVCRFLIIYIFLQFSHFVYNLLSININIESQTKFVDIENNLLRYDISSLQENKDSANIFFIILDGMMTLDSAEKLKIIENKKAIRMLLGY